MMSDLISRKATMNAMREEFDWLASQHISSLYLPECEERVISILSGMADAQPERAKGKWEYVGLVGEILFPYPICSVCKKTSAPFIEPKFCPHCGASMTEDGE